jgi:transcriptional regulator with XRE-family HTH domain
MKTIGNRVRDLRKAKGFARQSDLGKVVGVDQSVISDIENGAGFKADVLMALCEHLDTTAEYLMLGEGQASQGEAEMLTLYRKTNDEGRIAMIVTARGLQAVYPRVEKISTPLQKMGEMPIRDVVRTDTLVAKQRIPKQVEYSISGTSKKGTQQGDKRTTAADTDTERQLPKRGKHAAPPASTSRARRN